MITLFKAECLFGCSIKPVEVERQTDSSIWVDGKRMTRATRNYRYFDTWEEAHQWLRDKENLRVTVAERKLSDAKRRMELVMAMEPPVKTKDELNKDA